MEKSLFRNKNGQPWHEGVKKEDWKDYFTSNTGNLNGVGFKPDYIIPGKVAKKLGNKDLYGFNFELIPKGAVVFNNCLYPADNVKYLGQEAVHRIIDER